MGCRVILFETKGVLYVWKDCPPGAAPVQENGEESNTQLSSNGKWMFLCFTCAISKQALLRCTCWKACRSQVSPHSILSTSKGVTVSKASQSHAMCGTEGIALLKLGHIQKQRGLLGNKRVWYSTGDKWSGSVTSNMQSSSAESQKGVIVEPKHTCASPS